MTKQHQPKLSVDAVDGHTIIGFGDHVLKLKAKQAVELRDLLNAQHPPGRDLHAQPERQPKRAVVNAALLSLPGWRTVDEIAEAAGLTNNNTRAHLHNLSRAGIAEYKMAAVFTETGWKTAWRLKPPAKAAA